MKPILHVEISVTLGTFKLDCAFELENNITVLTGASGSGKSTILNCIAGIRTPETGKISCNESVFFDSTQKINVPPQHRNCGYVLQNPALFPHMSVSANVCFGISNLSKEEQKYRSQELLELVKLPDFGVRKISELSGGQAQRVALARALATKPNLLLLDEPFSALDSQLREELGQELKELQKELSIPILMVTHSNSEALSLAHTLVVLDQGAVLRSGTPAEIISREQQVRCNQEFKFSW